VKIRELVPESQAYMDLLAFEQKLDATITRKKLDIQESLKRPQKVKKRLRIYISHTFIAGKEPEKEGEEGSVPMWELRVEGRLIEDQVNGSTAASGHSTPAPAARPLPKKKFSSFFKSLVIELDKDIYGPDNHLVEWHRTPTTNETDGFQDPVDHDTVNNDTFLEQVFSCKRMRFMEIPQRLHQLLQQPDPLVLTHIIKHNEGGAEKNTACYDIG
ncbi:hypothetical protein Angca_007658, partial [Angiostrongylus cantonensis]